MRLIPRGSPVAVALGRSGLAAFASRHDARWSMSARAEPWHKILLILDGSGRIERPDAGAPVILGPSVLVLVPQGVAHRLVDDPASPLVLVGVCLDAQRLACTCGPAWAGLAARWSRGVVLGDDARAEAVRLIGGLMDARPSKRADDGGLARWARMLQVLSTAATASPPRREDAGHDEVDAILAWIDAHLGEPIALTALAARAGIAYRTLSSRVRRRTGESVLARILRLRLDRAARLLKAGMPVAEAALASGFGDLSGFYRQFRRRYGTTPGRMARMARMAE